MPAPHPLTTEGCSISLSSDCCLLTLDCCFHPRRRQSLQHAQAIQNSDLKGAGRSCRRRCLTSVFLGGLQDCVHAVEALPSFVSRARVQSEVILGELETGRMQTAPLKLSSCACCTSITTSPRPPLLGLSQGRCKKSSSGLPSKIAGQRCARAFKAGTWRPSAPKGNRPLQS